MAKSMSSGAWLQIIILISSLVSQLLPCSPTVSTWHGSQRDIVLKYNSDPITLLLKILPWLPSHSEQKQKSVTWPTGPCESCHLALPSLWLHLITLILLHSRNIVSFCSVFKCRILPPQGLCLCCFLSLKCSYPDSHMDYSFTSFRPLFKCHFLIEAFADLKSQPSLVPSLVSTY